MIEPSFHLHVDSADLHELATVLPHPLVHGVTTNPTLLRRAGVDAAALQGLVEQVLAWSVPVIHVQVTSRQVDAIVGDAQRIVALAPGRVIPKIPATRAGFDAGRRLADTGVLVTYTAVYEPEQALFAAISGAAYVAPYLGRLLDAGRDGLEVIRRMQDYVSRYSSDTRLLVASVRSREAFLSVLDLGVGAVTVPPRLLADLLDHAATLVAEDEFLADAGEHGSRPAARSAR